MQVLGDALGLNSAETDVVPLVPGAGRWYYGGDSGSQPQRCIDMVPVTLIADRPPNCCCSSLAS